MANSAGSDIRSTIHPYTNLKLHQTEGPLVITEGHGVFVRDENGKEYLEGLAGLWSASLGFSERRLAEAAHRQMLKLPFYHTFAHKAVDASIELAEKLLSIAPVPISRSQAEPEEIRRRKWKSPRQLHAGRVTGGSS